MCSGLHSCIDNCSIASLTCNGEGMCKYLPQPFSLLSFYCAIAAPDPARIISAAQSDSIALSWTIPPTPTSLCWRNYTLREFQFNEFTSTYYGDTNNGFFEVNPSTTYQYEVWANSGNETSTTHNHSVTTPHGIGYSYTNSLCNCSFFIQL